MINEDRSVTTVLIVGRNFVVPCESNRLNLSIIDQGVVECARRMCRWAMYSPKSSVWEKEFVFNIFRRICNDNLSEGKYNE